MDKKIEFYDIYDYYYQPLLQRSEVKVPLLILSILLIIGIVFLVIYFVRKNKKLKKISSWEWAIIQLNSLSLDKCQTKKDYKKFYFDLTGIVKKYFHQRYDWKIEDKTDEEVVTFLKEKQFDPQLLSKFLDVTKEALWIKFANQEALKIQAQKDLKAVNNIIQSAIPQEQEKQ